MGAMLVDRLGYKKTILSSLLVMCPLIALVTFAPNKGALLAGEILCGLPWGVFVSAGSCTGDANIGDGNY